MRDDRGFTLVEMLLTVALMGLVFTPIVMAFTFGAETQRDADELALGSQAPRMLSAWMTGDVQSASTLALGTATCPVPGGAIPLLGITQADPSGSTTYAQRTASDGIQLLRVACGAMGTGVTTVASPLESDVIVTCPDCPTLGATVTVTVDPIRLPPASVSIAQRRNG